MARTKEKTVDLRKYSLDIQEVTVRKCNGDDTIDAASRVVPTGDGDIHPRLFGIMHRQQMIAQSIVSYTDANGKLVKCSGPCVESLGWDNQTREFIATIYDHLNDVEGDVLEGFKKELAGVGSVPATTPAT